MQVTPHAGQTDSPGTEIEQRLLFQTATLLTATSMMAAMMAAPAFAQAPRSPAPVSDSLQVSTIARGLEHP